MQSLFSDSQSKSFRFDLCVKFAGGNSERVCWALIGRLAVRVVMVCMEYGTERLCSYGSRREEYSVRSQGWISISRFVFNYK